jgi:hypothetical protein
LILSVLNTARTVKKIIRSQKIEFNKEDEEVGRNYGSTSELPPLRMRRGKTTIF